MRKLILATLAMLVTWLAAPVAEARRADGVFGRGFSDLTDNRREVRRYSKSRSLVRGQYRGRYVLQARTRHGASRLHTKRAASRQGSSRRGFGGASASRACLTGAARALLGRIEAQFGPVEIVSTCRPGARIATSGKISKHASGQAIDFRAPGRKRQVVQWLIANHHSGGTMTYSDMDHIHVDVGYRFVALSRPSGRS